MSDEKDRMTNCQTRESGTEIDNFFIKSNPSSSCSVTMEYVCCFLLGGKLVAHSNRGKHHRITVVIMIIIIIITCIKLSFQRYTFIHIKPNAATWRIKHFTLREETFAWKVKKEDTKTVEDEKDKFLNKRIHWWKKCGRIGSDWLCII